MPEQRLAKARKTLPEGYQFGDANSSVLHVWPSFFDWYESMIREGNETPNTGWNTIEAEHQP